MVLGVSTNLLGLTLVAWGNSAGMCMRMSMCICVCMCMCILHTVCTALRGDWACSPRHIPCTRHAHAHAVHLHMPCMYHAMHVACACMSCMCMCTACACACACACCMYHEPATWSGDLIANTTVAKGGDGGPTQGAKMALAACFGEGL